MALLALCACVRPAPLPPPGVPSVRGPAAEQRAHPGGEPRPEARDPDSLQRASRGEQAGVVVVAGRRHPVAVPVVTFTDPRGFDAHAVAPSATVAEDGPSGARYLPGRNREAKLALYGQELDDLRSLVDLVVLHYDACGTSRRCFEVLHELRGLSCHFLVDADGTIYQTLDLADTAWHAGPVNARSIGIEIAHVGAEAPGATDTSDRWYREGPAGPRLAAPPEAEPTGWRPDFVGRPARPDRVWGRVQGQTLVQYDFTLEQYAALGVLVAELARLFPRVALAVPRDARGRVREVLLDDAELASFAGLVGHWHVGGHKVDPGPAFDWERLLALARAAHSR